jgi:hypothetical protein
VSHSFRFDARTELKHQRIEQPIRWLTPSLWSSLNVLPEDCARLYVVTLEPQTLLHRVYPRLRGTIQRCAENAVCEPQDI